MPGEDRGGLVYPIEVPDNFSNNLRFFITLLDEAKRSFREFKSETSDTGSNSSLKDSADALARLKKQQEELNRVRQKSNANLSLQQKAERSYAKDVENAALAREKARISESRHFALQRRLLSAQQQRAKAEQNITSAINKNLVRQQQLNSILERQGEITQKQALSMGLASKVTDGLSGAQTRLYKIQLKLNAARQAAGDIATLSAKAETKALEIQARAKEKLLTEEILARKGLSSSGQSILPVDSAASREAKKNLKDVKDGLEKTANAGQRTSFTLRRLLTVFAAFSIVRSVAQGFKTLVSEAVKFNAQIEISELGIGAIIASTSDLFTFQGKVAGAAERLAAAQGLAKEQVRQLRLEALGTTAVFEDLVVVFQTALAPGLRAGLDLDQIRKFSKQISIAATAVGLAQDQLAEEVRSLLTATIRPQNTRIATFLGISNKDIINAKNAGTLFDFLQQKFSVFDAAAEKTGNTFSGLVNRLSDGVKIATSEGTFAFFEDFKTLLREVNSSIVTLDKQTGQLAVNKEVLAFIQQFSDILRNALKEVNRLKQSLSPRELITIAKGIKELANTIVSLGGRTIEGAAKGFRDVAVIIGAIRIAVEGLSKTLTGSGSSISNVVFSILTLVVRIATTIALITIPLRLLRVLLGATGVLGAFKGIFDLAKKAIIPIGKIPALIRSSGGALAALRLGFRGLLTVVAPIATLISLIVVGLASAVGLVDISNFSWMITLSKHLTTLMLSFQRLKTVVSGTLTGTMDIGKLREIENALGDIDRLAKSQMQTADSVGDVVNKTLEKIRSAFPALASAAEGSFDDAATAAKKFTSEMEVVLSASSEAVKEVLNSFDDLDKEIRNISGGTGISKKLLGLSDEISSLIRTREEETLNALEKNRDIRREILTIEKALQRVQDEISVAEGTASEKELEKLFALNNSLNANLGILRNVENLASSKFQDIATQKSLQALFDSNQLNRQEAAFQRIEALSDRAIANARLTLNVRQEQTLETEKELAVLEETSRQRQQQFNKNIAGLEEERQLALQRLSIVSAIAEAERTDQDNNRLIAEQNLVEALGEQISLLQQREDFNRISEDAAKRQIQLQLEINRAAETNPVAAGIGQSLIDAFTVASDHFQTTLDVMRDAISGFGSFIATTITDAFDPNKSGNAQERFGQFLLSLANQIISTLVQLAVTAIALNLASGGILGPLLQNLAKARGFGLAEGGEVGKEWEKRRNTRRFRHAAGFAGGGTPNARKVSGVSRPAGLHPRDTIPAWLDPREWVIRGESVALAGADALRKINEGNFDPQALRSVLGLHPKTKRIATITKAGPGLFAGGPANSVQPVSGKIRNELGRIGAGNNVSVVVPNEEHAERIFRQGRKPLVKILSELGYRPG